MTNMNTKPNRVYYVLQMNLKCDANEATNWIQDRSVKYTKDLQEEKTLSFEWFVSQDGKEATLIESFVDSDAMMVRLGNHVNSPLAAEVTEHVEITNVIYGFFGVDCYNFFFVKIYFSFHIF